MKDRVQWAVIGLEPGLPDWTSEEATISYQGFQLTLRPETEDRLATIAIPYVLPQTFQGSINAGYRFLSAFAWLHDGRGRVESSGTTGGGGPIWLGKSAWHQKHRPNFGGKFRLDDLQEPASSDSKTWRALAIYREARYVNSVSYELLGYFRIINILAADVLRLHKDMPLARALAEYAIEHALGVKSSLTIYSEHLYQLTGFRALLGATLVERLKTDDSVAATDLPSLPDLSLRFRDVQIIQAFARLDVVQVHVEKGVVWLLLQSQDRLAAVALGLNFRSERLLLDFENGIAVGDDGSPAAVEKELDRLRILECCLYNGELEVWNGETEVLLGRTDAIVPVNIDSGRSIRFLRDRTVALKAELERRLKGSVAAQVTEVRETIPGPEKPKR